MSKKFAATGLVLLAGFLIFASLTWAHDGEHKESKGHSKFEEGSGSSAVDDPHPGGEYSRHGKEYGEGHGGEHGEGTYGHKEMKEHGKDYEEEGSGGMQKGEHSDKKAHKPSEGSH